MLSLQRKKELILEAEEAFTRSISQSLIDKPEVSFWMILIPIFFLFFFRRMKTYQRARWSFETDFMRSRSKALDLALESATFQAPPRIDEWIGHAGLSPELVAPYRRWLIEMTGYHGALLGADGEDFAALVRSAYPRREGFQEVLDRIGAAEEAFHVALRPTFEDNPAAAEVVASIETHARNLRRELVEALFA